jgi:hypothetical protein
MPGDMSVDLPRGDYSGWLAALAIIGVVFIVAAALWIHFHG